MTNIRLLLAGQSPPLALSRACAAVAAQAAEAPTFVQGRVGALVLELVETVNIYITVVYGGDGDDPPLITVQGR